MSEKEGRRGWGVVAEYVIIFIVAFALAYILQNFIFGNFIIKQHSMEPTL
jgi:signal peptidase I